MVNAARMTSAALKALVKRVRTSSLSAADKAAVLEILSETIKMRQLVEKARVSRGGKKVLVSLPFGFEWRPDTASCRRWTKNHPSLQGGDELRRRT